MLKNLCLSFLGAAFAACVATAAPTERWWKGAVRAGEPDGEMMLADGEVAQVVSLYGGAFVDATELVDGAPTGPEVRMVKGDAYIGPCRLLVGASTSGAVAVVHVFPASNAMAVNVTLEIATNSPAAFFHAK